MDGLIPVTWPIREDKPRTRFEAMEVDVIGPPPREESDSDGECECSALYASGRGGPCYYCAKEGHLLRSCPRKAAGLPRSAPFIEDKGGCKDEAKWSGVDQPPKRQEWSGSAAEPTGVGEGPLPRVAGATAATAEGELARTMEGGARAGWRAPKGTTGRGHPGSRGGEGR